MIKKYLDSISINKSLFFQSKIIGLLLIIVGVILWYKPTSLNMKIGTVSILIGIIVMLMITGKNTKKRIKDTQIALILIGWILIIFFLTGINYSNLDIFFVLALIGLLVIKEISSGFITTSSKLRMNIFIFFLLLIFLLIVVHKIITMINQ